MITKQRKLIVCLVLLLLGWQSPVWAVSFDCDALNEFSAFHTDCFGETSRRFRDGTGQYTITIDQKDSNGECNSGYDRLRLEDKNGVEIWSVDVPEGTAGDYVREHWDTIFKDDIPSIVNTPTMLRLSTTHIASLISRYIARIMAPKGGRSFLEPPQDDDGQTNDELKSELVTGLAAGDQLSRFSLWANAGYSDWDDDNRTSDADGYLSTFIVGADYRLAESVVLGLSLIYEHSDIDTDYNNGHLDQDGFTVAPYLGIVLNDYFTLAATVGYAWLDTDQKREKGSDHAVKSSLDSTRFFGSVHLDGFYRKHNFNLTGILGCLYSQERQDSFTEDDKHRVGSHNIDLGELSVGAEVSYSFIAAEPYFAATFLYDFQYEDVKNVDYDDTAVELNPGVRFYLDNGFCADIQAGFVLGRSEYDEYSFTANLRYEF